MSNDIKKISWKQNGMHLSEVFIAVEFMPDEEIKFLLQKDMVNYLFQKRNDKIEMHFNLNRNDRAEVCVVDFSKIKALKPVYPLLQKNMKLPKIEKISNESVINGDATFGVYSIFHPDSSKWLTNEGWESDQACFDIVPEKIIESNLSVSIIPQKAVDSGAGWRVKEMEWKESNSIISIERGNCVVEFKALEDWIAPKDQQVYIMEGIDEHLSAEYRPDRSKFMRREPMNVLSIFLILFVFFFGVYWLVKSPSPGMLVTAISPSEVVVHGAKWRIEDGEWQVGNGSIELEAGEYEVEFSSMDGWQNPSIQHVSLKGGQTTQIDVSYNRKVVVKIMPEAAAQDGAQWKIRGESGWHDSGESLMMTQRRGQQIIFKEIDGWTTPAGKAVSNSMRAIAAEYRREPSGAAMVDRSIMVEIGPYEAVQAGARWKLEGPGEWKAGGETISGLINIPYTVIFKSVEGWKKPHSIKLSGQRQIEIVKEGIYQKVLMPAKAEGEKK